MWDLIAVGTLVSSGLGALCHFTYEWSGNNFIVGLFTPVNESVWEHLKLVWLPMLLWALVSAHEVTNTASWVFACVAASVPGMVLVVLGYRLFVAIAQSDSLAYDLVLYVVTMFIVNWGATYIERAWRVSEPLAAAVVVGMLTVFAVATIVPEEYSLSRHEFK